MTTDLARPLSVDFGKVAAGPKVGQDPNGWATDVLKHLAEEHAYLLEGTQINPVWKATDARTGYGFGGLYISNALVQQPQYRNYGEMQTYSQQNSFDPQPKLAKKVEAVQTIVIPLFVADFELSPLDIFVYDRRVYPLTERRIAEVMSGGRIFGVDEPKMPDTGYMGDSGDASLVDKLYPPPEAVHGYGFGGQGDGAHGHGLTSFASVGSGKIGPFLSDVIAPTITPEHRDEFFAFCKKGEDELGLMMAGGLDGFIQKILGHAEAAKEHADVDHQIHGKGMVVRIRPAAGRDGIFEVTKVPDEVYEPWTGEMSLSEVLGEFGNEDPDLRGELLSGETVLLTLDHEVKPTAILEDFEARVDPVIGEGVFYLLDRDGDIRPYYVCPQVSDFAGHIQEGAKIFSDGKAWGMQAALVGEPAENMLAELPDGQIKPGIWGSFVYRKNGAKCMTVPFRIQSQTIDLSKSRLSFTVIDLYGAEHLVIVTPKIRKITSATGIEQSDVGSLVGGNIWHVPSSYKFVSLGRQTSAAEHPDQMARGLRPLEALAVEKHLGDTTQKHFRIEGDTSHDEERRRASEKIPINLPNSPRAPGSWHENTMVAVRKLPSPGLFQLTGMMMEDQGECTYQQELVEKEAIFLLATYGMSLQGARDALARSMQTPAAIHIVGLRQPGLREVKTAGADLDLLNKIAEKLRTPMWKEAAALRMPLTGLKSEGAVKVALPILQLGRPSHDKIALEVMQPEEETIDHVLSLGFINPQNVANFLAKIEELKASEQLLGELLIMIRLGMQGIEEKPVQSALKSLNKVVEGLEALSSYGEYQAA